EISPKLVELLHELVPTATVIGLLLNPANSNAIQLTKNVEAAATGFGQKLVVVTASNEDEIGSAFATLVKQRVGAFVVVNDALFLSRRSQLVELAARNAIPAAYSYREAVTRPHRSVAAARPRRRGDRVRFD
ncbi:MAG TPA: ABC transporter substrate binding protein, partial [Candidatus Limnocylindrales bacterium]|nr:ABC transporter substrate binding protein [Candidatus Limnocylindrales bacterium]